MQRLCLHSYSAALNVTFLCAALVDGDTGRMAIYYGAADTVTGLVFTNVSELVDWIMDNAVSD